jgi:hypothetical protein
MTDDRLTDELAARVMGWRLGPGRYLKAGRSWLPRWRFAPLKNLDDAFEVLNQAGAACMLVTNRGGRLEASVQVGEATGEASGEQKARVITTALLRALGLDPPEDAETPAEMPTRGHSLSAGSKAKGA